jgi:hypothetical protein
VDGARRLLEWQAAQEEIVDQAEDGSIQPNPERERDYGEKSKSGRFAELSQSEPKIIHHSVRKA